MTLNSDAREHRVPNLHFQPSDMEDLEEDWWQDVPETDLRTTFTLEDEDWWTSGFLPPPPRPPFLGDVESDGLTTCDLCTWARHPYQGPDFAGVGEVSWVMTLIIVSFLSALIGAIVMITVIRCRKLKHLGHTAGSCWCFGRDTERDVPQLNMTTRAESRASSKAHEGCAGAVHDAESVRRTRVWTWLARRNVHAPAQLGQPAPPVADNHYTVDEAYPPNNNEEALYAELDRESNSSPAYQNTGYSGSEQEPPSSAPSSAYYSDLSCAPSDRTYEAVGPPEPAWDRRPPPRVPKLHSDQPWAHLPPQIRLTAIAETLSGSSETSWSRGNKRQPRGSRNTKTVPSDYV